MHAQHCTSCGVELEVGALYCRKCGAATPTAITQGHTLPVAAHVERGAGQEVVAELSETLAPKITVLQRLGAGGMGEVYLARDEELARLVAIKLLLPEFASDPDLRVRFLREAEAASAVAHPHVVAIYSVGTLPRSGAPYFVMQYIEGRSLADELQRCGTIPEVRAKRILGQVASALVAAHERGLVHRDIKPANIMLAAADDRAVVLDFGIAAAFKPRALKRDEQLTSEGASIGTPTYMSPEQAQALALTGASDIYSLGVVAFELLAGHPPFVADNAFALMAMHIREEPPLLSAFAKTVSASTIELIGRCLSKTPASRPTPTDITRTLLPESLVAFEWPQNSLAKGVGVLRGIQSLLRLSAALYVLWWLVVFALPTPHILTVALSAQEQATYHVAALWWASLPLLGRLRDEALIWYALVGGLGLVALCMTFVALLRLARVVGVVRRGLSLGFPLRLLIAASDWNDVYLRDLLAGVGVFSSTTIQSRQRRLRFLAWIAALPTLVFIYLVIITNLLLLVGWDVDAMNHASGRASIAIVAVLIPPMLLLGVEAVIRHQLRIDPVDGFLLLHRPARSEVQEAARWRGLIPMIADQTTYPRRYTVGVLAGWVVVLGMVVILSRGLGLFLGGVGSTIVELPPEAEWVSSYIGRRYDRGLNTQNRVEWAEAIADLESFVGATQSRGKLQWASVPSRGFLPCPSSSVWAQGSACEFGRRLQVFRDAVSVRTQPERLRQSIDALMPFSASIDSALRAARAAERPTSSRVLVSEIRGSHFRNFGYSYEDQSALWSESLWPAAVAARLHNTSVTIRELRRAAVRAVVSLSDPRPAVVHQALKDLGEIEAVAGALGFAYDQPVLGEWAQGIDRKGRVVRSLIVDPSRMVSFAAANPDAVGLGSLIADSTLPPTVRYAMLPNAIVRGVCYNWFEVSFGVDQQRGILLERLRATTGGDSLLGTFLSVYENELTLLASNPRASIERLDRATDAPDLRRAYEIVEVGPWRARSDRLQYCDNWYRGWDGHSFDDM